MSGGHFNYVGYRIMEGLQSIAEDEDVKENCPHLAEMLGDLGDALYEMEHSLDWHYSGDSLIEDMAAFEANAMVSLSKAVKA